MARDGVSVQRGLAHWSMLTLPDLEFYLAILSFPLLSFKFSDEATRVAQTTSTGANHELFLQIGVVFPLEKVMESKLSGNKPHYERRGKRKDPF